MLLKMARPKMSKDQRDTVQRQFLCSKHGDWKDWMRTNEKVSYRRALICKSLCLRICFAKNLSHDSSRNALQYSLRAQEMPRKPKRTEEWERRADERFEAQADQAVPTSKTTKVSKVTDVVDATVKEEPEKPEKPKAQHRKKCEAVDDILSQNSTVGSLEVLNAWGHGVSQDTDGAKCGGYKDGLGDFVAMDAQEGPSRNEVASLAFGHDSVRGAYEELGAAGFYELKGSSYVNPHEGVLSEAPGFLKQKALLLVDCAFPNCSCCSSML